MSITDHQVQYLLDYVALVEKWNRSINLVSRQDIDRLLSRHVLDSLSVNQFIKGATVVDVGTGAGFPGIPLAIVNPERSFTLCDRMAKRMRFLQVVKSQLQLSHVELLEKDFAKESDWVKPADTILARAVAPAATLWPLLEPSLAHDGRILVFSSTQTIDADTEELAVVEDSPYRCRAEQVAIPGLQQPHHVDILERH